MLSQVRSEQTTRLEKKRIAPPATATSWPPDYIAIRAWRRQQLNLFDAQPELVDSAWAYYATHPVEFINHWCDTYDPRVKHTLTKLPLILFPRQARLVEFFLACLDGETSGLVEKSRDMGATWVAVAFSVWLWIFRPSVAIGWGSQTQMKVDRLGDPSSIFEKIRMLIQRLPPQLLPDGFVQSDHLHYMRCVNPETGGVITGDVGDNIGRGGRTLIYFVDEAAHLEHPEAVEASLSENTRVRIDISSVSGLGSVFHRKRESGVEWQPGAKAIPYQTNVFILDWRNHPEKTEQWFEKRKQKATQDGLSHIFAREVARDYRASVENVIIKAEWVRAAIDAHTKLGFGDSGGWCAALDVADGGTDKNAFALRKGVVLKDVLEWGERDTGKTARRAVAACGGHPKIALQYDSIGVGSGIKAETNRLQDEKLLPSNITLVPWNAGASPLEPDANIIKGDKNSPKNGDFYKNLKAQAWWQLALRFERTFRAITEPDFTWKAEELISLDSTLTLLLQIEKELCQVTVSKSPSLKLVIDKTPSGTHSPNLADAIVMVFWPCAKASRYDATLAWVG